jgi:hypothetical protein
LLKQFLLLYLFNLFCMKTKNLCWLVGYILFSYCYFGVGIVYAQTPALLLKSINVSNLSALDAEKLAFWGRLDSMPNKKSLRLVKVGDVPSLQQNGTLTFTIPGVSQTITAQAIRVVDTDVKDYVWQAKIGETGYMQIVSKPDGVSGFIQLSNKYFTLFPLYKTYCALFEYDLSHATETCGSNDVVLPLSETESIQAPDYCYETSIIIPSTVDILVLITPEARQWVGGTFGTNWLNALTYVIGATESINMALVNSDILQKRVRTRYAALEGFPYSPPGDDALEDDIANLATNTTANQLREQYKADVVIMLTNDRYGASGIAAAGINNNLAYAIVEIQAIMSPFFGFAHEFGHLMGGLHNRSANVPCTYCQGSDNTDRCSHAWRFFDANSMERKTLIARVDIDDVDGITVPHYSNPDVNFNGTPTGTVDNDNAKIIRNSFTTVANFRSSPQMSAGIVGFKFLCTGSPNLYEAAVTPPAIGITQGQPPYTYEWRWNTTGIFNAALGGSSTLIASGTTATSITFNVPPICPSFFLQLRVTGSGGYTTTSACKIFSSPCIACGGSGKDIQTQPFSEANINVYPIPSDEQLYVQATQIGNQEHQIQLCDLQGKIVYSTVIQALDHQLQLSIPTAHLPQGLYYVRLLNNNAPIIKKIIIHH